MVDPALLHLPICALRTAGYITRCMKPTQQSPCLGMSLIAALLLSTMHVARAQTESAPVGSVETIAVSQTSPRDTMFTYLRAINRALDQQFEQTRQDRNLAWQIAVNCFDFDALDEPLDEPTRHRYTSDMLKILDRIGEVSKDQLPDSAQAKQRGLDSFIFFPRRSGLNHLAIQDKLQQSIMQSIVIAETDPGVWKFSRQTIEQLPQLWQTMSQLPPAYVPQTSQLLIGFGPTFEKTPVWGWGALLGGILAGLVMGKFASITMRSVATRLRSRDAGARGQVVSNAASPASLALLTLGIMIGLNFLYLEENLEDFSQKIIQFLFLLALGWLFYNLVDIVEMALVKITAKTETKLDDMIVPLVRKTLRIFLVITFTLVVAQNVFSLNITGWLAGLGIAGLAVSLAAQDSVKNLFGSITIFFDKPFFVGDFISFDNDVGTVEEIGFRSTRIRLRSGHLVTVPNMKFIDNKVENIAARPYIRRQMDVTITYDTPPDKIEEAQRILSDILNDAQVVEEGRFDMDQFPPRIAFNELNADSLNIRAYYWYQMADDPDRGFFTYLDHCQLVNMKLFRAYATAGIEFAFPTQTLYVVSDPARKLTVEAQISGTAAGN